MIGGGGNKCPEDYLDTIWSILYLGERKWLVTEERKKHNNEIIIISHPEVRECQGHTVRIISF